MSDAVSRFYTPSDYSACLAVFESNVPAFFATEERADCCEYFESVNEHDRPCFVKTLGSSVIACGGLIIEAEKQQARLAWGMVDLAHHGRGLGTKLTEVRLALVRTLPNILEVGLETSQHTCGFYERFGFVVSRITPDGFSPGLDCCDMQLALK